MRWSTKPVKIEKGIPIPFARNKGFYVDLLEKMEPGDSVLFETQAEASALVSAAKTKGKKVLTRKTDGGYRAWYVGMYGEREALCKELDDAMSRAKR